jgi:predicted AAA+ superfamily ATPase
MTIKKNWGCPYLLIITLDSMEEFTENGVAVKVIPLYRWLLG